MVLISFSLGIGIEVGLLKYVEAKGRMVATMGGCWLNSTKLQLYKVKRSSAQHDD